jgi:hypothetical protein
VGGAVDDAVGDAVGGAVRGAVGDAVGGAVDDAVGGAVGGAVDGAVRDAVGGAVRGAVGGAVDGAVRGAVGDAVRGAVGDAVGGAVDDAVGDAVGGAVGDDIIRQAVSEVIRQSWHRYIGGQFWVGGWWWGGAYTSFFREICDLKLRGDLWKRGKAYEETLRSACWWWPHRDFVMVSERPTEIHLELVDPNRPRGWGSHRLHNDHGAALLFRDGWGIWSIHGVHVPSKVIEAPETLTFEEVRDEPNTEVRRHMLARYGGLRGSLAAGKWISDGGLKPISTCDITAKMQPSGLSIWKLSHGDEPVLCKLYRAELPDDEPLHLLWVACTSTAKETFLRVPPTIRDAAKARDWTFGDSVKLADAVET